MELNDKPHRPVHEIRLGLVRAAIWKNESLNGVRYNVTITRIYKDGEQWKHSNSFGRDDLPLLAKVADRAHTWLYGLDSLTPTPDPADQQSQHLQSLKEPRVPPVARTRRDAGVATAAPADCL